MLKQRKVALLVESSRKYGQDLLYGVIRYSHEHHPWVFYRDPVWGEDFFERIKNWGVEGIFAHVGSDVKAQRLQDLKVPLILSETLPPEKVIGPLLVADDQAIGQLAARYFLERNYENFAFIGYQSRKYFENQWSLNRGIAFQQTASKAGFKCNIFDCRENLSQMSIQQEQAIIADWLCSLPSPTALLACNDDMAQRILMIARIQGIDVPEQLSVLGVDNDELVCHLSDPPLSSIRLSTEQTAYRAAAILDRMMDGEPVGAVDLTVIPLEIITRRSTRHFATDHPTLKKALAFIRDRAKTPLGVTDVADAVYVSRRSLERLFRQKLHRSVADEIRRVRAEHIADLLSGTDLKVSQIAQMFGYPTVGHMARAFRQVKGCTPQAYRSKPMLTGISKENNPAANNGLSE